MAAIAIVSFQDGPEELKVLSNLAHTPFIIDGDEYQTAEGFWQGLKTIDVIARQKIASYTNGFDAQQAGRRIFFTSKFFIYQGRMYRVATEDHHVVFERALRAKVQQNRSVQETLLSTGNQPIRHMHKTRYGTWRPGDSPALPAVVFEKMLMRIRNELHTNSFDPELPLPEGMIPENDNA